MSNDKPFAFPDGYWLDLNHKVLDRSLRDYVQLFLQRRNERPNGRFVAADIDELMRLAEDLDMVDGSETTYLLDLARNHPDYFADTTQKTGLELFARTHEALLKARKDEITKDLIAAVPVSRFRKPEGLEFLSLAQALSDVLKASDAYYNSHGMFDPVLIREVTDLATQLGQLADGLTLSDIDDSGGDARAVFLRDLTNLLARPGGHTQHEAEWKDGRWRNWNRDVAIYPVRYAEPRTTEELRQLVEGPGPIRMVAGGHAFNISSSMGGSKDGPIGTLITLDSHELSPGKRWVRVSSDEAIANYKISAEESRCVVRASAGIRLRDFSRWMWADGMALPVAGSTDAQSLGGLIATDLHSTGKSVGFLSSQLLEVNVFDAEGKRIRFSKNESVPRGQPGRWVWTPVGGQPQLLPLLPVAGALGVLGVVSDVVLKLEPSYNMVKSERFVPRVWAEANIERLLDTSESDPIFANDHLSFYYTGGAGDSFKTIRMNSWRRTRDPLSPDGAKQKTMREINDLLGSGFLPDYIIKLSRSQAATPGQPPQPADDQTLSKMNKRKPLVLTANEAFARELFYQHDEIEVGIPLSRNADGTVSYRNFRSAIQETLDLLNREEFKTIVEVRFTPDVSEAMLGPGTGGPTCYIELATAFGDYSKARIVQLFSLFDRLMRQRYGARPHLGKKTTVTHADMETLYGQVWREFQAIRGVVDPDNRFLPKENTLLRQIFQT